MEPLLRVIEPAKGRVEGSKPPFVPEGIYEMLMVDHETLRLAGGRAPKLAVWFRITSLGEFQGVKLPRYYNARLEGKPRRHGAFRVGWRSAFVRDYAHVTGRAPSSKSGISPEDWYGLEIRAAVRTVTSGWAQRKGDPGCALPPVLYYSVVDRLLPAVAVSPRPAPAPTPTS